jgi:lysophospholipase L1-like esterase
MNHLNRRTLIAGSLGVAVSLPVLAQVPDGCGNQPNTAPALQPPVLLTDWAWLARYRDDNQRLLTSGEKINAVFLGDSITEGWANADKDFFSKGIVGRGISAQTTPQLLVRMFADVIALKPRVVHIMAGTNDIAHNTGPMTAQDSHNNIMAMCAIAKENKIRVVLASVPPASKYWWRPDAKPKAEALAMNEWLRGYAKKIGAHYADYATAMTDAQGNAKLDLTPDEVHPTKEGYAVMRPIAAAAIR